MKTKQELENNFHWWITCIPDRIESLKHLLPKDISSKLNFTLESLNVLGKFLVQNETLESIQSKKELWDCLASYIGVVYEKNLDKAKWSMELEDDKNIYYGIPTLRTDVLTNFSPYNEITTMLDRKRPDYLFALTKRHIELQIPKQN